MNPEPKRIEGFEPLSDFGKIVRDLRGLPGAPLSSSCLEKLLLFYYELPFQLPWPVGFPVSLLLGQDSFVAFRFEVKQRSQLLWYGFPGEAYYTATTMACPVPSPFDQSTMSDAFDRGVAELNELVMTYAALTKDVDVFPITLHALPVAVPWIVIRSSDLAEETHGLFMLHFGVPYRKEDVEPDRLKKVTYLTFAQSAGQHPFVFPEFLMVSARRHLRFGPNELAIVLATTSFELFMNTVLRFLLYVEGAAPEKSEEVFRQPFVSRIRSQYHPRIGGNFTLKGTNPMSTWHARAHLARNSILHAGARPALEAAREAVDAVQEARIYIKRLLEKRKKRFGEILKYL